MRRSALAPARLAAGLALAGLAAGVALAAGPAAAQQAPLNVDLRDADTSSTDHISATVALSGPAWAGERLAAEAFRATVNGRPVTIKAASPLAATGREVAVVLAIDVSGSMKDANKLAAAKAAADAFLDAVRNRERVGLVTFSSAVTVAQEPTPSAGKLRSAIRRLQAGGNTRLWDAVVQASELLSAETAQRNLILLSDGKDDGSQAALPAAIDAAKKGDVTIYTVGLGGGQDQDLPALAKLAAATHGRFSTASKADLAGLYARLGQELYSQYVVDVTLPRGLTSQQVDFALTVTVGGASGTVARKLLLRQLPRTARSGPAGLQPAAPLSRLETPAGLYFIAGLVFVAVLLFTAVLVSSPPGGGRPYRALRQRLSHYSLTPALAPPATVFGSSELAGRATQLAEALVRRGNLEETFLGRLEAAGSKLRVAEFVLISLACAFALPLLLLVLSRNLLVAALGVVLGVAGPFLWLSVKASRHRAKFAEQLPETLQLLAGALQAGHSLLQAVDTVVQEGEDPVASEFQRVLTESRLGMPLEDALQGTAKRMRSLDFEWTVMAINLQRQVGGNLSEVLNTVAATIRERYFLFRQVRTLSAEGRLSAIILSVLPFLMFCAIMILNPTFLAPLYTTSIGLVLLVVAGILMGLGMLWLKKLTTIKV